MKEKLDTRILKDSISTLKDAYELYLQNDEEKLKSALQDSCIKRFEYTYETAKKFMNKYLKYAFDKSDLPVDNVFREMYGLELIDDYEHWVDYRIKRNDTSHEYNLKKAHKIMNVLPVFIKDAEDFADKLNKILEK